MEKGGIKGNFTGKLCLKASVVNSNDKVLRIIRKETLYVSAFNV